MKQVTKQAVEAFLAHKRFKLRNTEVDTSTDSNMAYLRLFGNVIVNHNRTTGELSITTAGWPSVTTKERLGALPGVNLSTSKLVLYLNGKPWDGSWKTICLVR